VFFYGLIENGNSVSVADTVGSGWSAVNTFQLGGGGNFGGQFFYAVAGGSGSNANTVTFTYGNYDSGTTGAVAVFEFSGTATVSPFDSNNNYLAGNGASTGYTTSLTMGFNTSFQNDLVISSIGYNYETWRWFCGSDSNLVYGNIGTASVLPGFQWKVAPAAGSVTSTFANNGAYITPAMMQASFKASTTSAVSGTNGAIYINTAQLPRPQMYVYNVSTWVPIA
jgi:hypothetical protein